MDRTVDDYTGINFDKVYSYIQTKIDKGNQFFYQFESYELYIKGQIQISLKKEAYTLAVIHKEKGVFSLAKGGRDNTRLVEDAKQLFSKILLIIENQN